MTLHESSPDFVEEWRTIREFPLYEVSSTGYVRHSRTGKYLRVYGNDSQRNGNDSGRFVKIPYRSGHKTARAITALVQRHFGHNPIAVPGGTEKVSVPLSAATPVSVTIPITPQEELMTKAKNDDDARALIESVEEWKPLSINPAYSISSAGEVRGSSGEVMTKYIRGGHNQVNVKTFGKDNSEHMFGYRLDYLVLTNFVSPQLMGWGPHHLDGDNLNDALSNLEWRFGAESGEIKRRARHKPLAGKGQNVLAQLQAENAKLQRQLAELQQAPPIAGMEISVQIGAISATLGAGVLTLASPIIDLADLEDLQRVATKAMKVRDAYREVINVFTED